MKILQLQNWVLNNRKGLRMNFDELKNLISECDLVDGKIVLKSNLFKTIELIKNIYKFDVLKSITAVDNADGTIELQYRLYSIGNEEDVLVSINVFEEADSIVSLFDSACADENEIYDLFGVKFLGNKALKRLYLPENWIGHPLKKDYVENDERLNWNDKT